MGSVLATTAFFGCRANQGPERVVVAGTVTYRGEPIKRGVIRFVPSRGTIAPVSVGPILDGKYACTYHGGVPVGTHKIEVTALRHKRQQSAAPASDLVGRDEGGEMEQFIPEKYNTQTTLEITIPSGSGKTTKNLDLTD
jgi:hypothetical protein